MRNYKILLEDILRSIDAIEDFVRDITLDRFIADDKTSSAVLRKLEVIGEAVKNVPDNIKKKKPNIPWKEMAGMRDKLIHFYFGVDYNLVWQTIKNRLPEIKKELLSIIEGDA
ncbi:MAG: hypothetical protein FD145_416 [Candidatus Saganbacteria bacterium]|uniref:DUF86 domain-containing protein n=1 Tax=Candidatus Saganbacteria bacterium TaxID=2575572 RepID=A0A833L1X2_UNCSA|nr:MAG: hypothetical protein FD145_416 [Candidatus Saganbacteria bacterium]